MEMLASRAIGKQGSVIAGNALEVVVIKVNPGYSNNSGRPGTGTVVGVYCHERQ